jgi:hypothetical protein
MNDEPAVRAASASVLGELGTALRQAVAQMRADDVTARRTADGHTATRLSQIDRRLDEILGRLPPPSPSSAGTRRNRGLFLGPITAVMVVAFAVVLALAGAIGGKVGDRAYANGRAAGYAEAAAFERDHPAQWRAYQHSTVSLRGR